MFGKKRKERKKQQNIKQEDINEEMQPEITYQGLAEETLDSKIRQTQEEEKYSYKNINTPTVQLTTEPDMVNIGLESHIGARKYQQDSAIASTNCKEIAIERKKTIGILCDGMGGMNGGELASNFTVNQIYSDYNELIQVPNYYQWLNAEVEKVDRKVSSFVDVTGKNLKAGCTLLVTVIDNSQLYWASVGDSRIYIIREKQILQVTTDHNYLMLLKKKVESGEMTLETAMRQKKREALVSYIGMNGVKYIDINQKPFQLVSGDWIIMCSDGLYRSLTEERMCEIALQNGDNAASAAQEMVNEAVACGGLGQDNTTVIVMKYL